MTKDDILASCTNMPDETRKLLKDKSVAAAMESLGIHLSIFELHAPAPSAKTRTGLGITLCGRNARRHPSLVTCKHCLAKSQS